jgi:cytochrome c-type biogenesis protein CcmH/NrfG
MEAQNVEPRRWSNALSYGLAVICLIAGIAFGYLFHGSAGAKIPAQNVAAQGVIPGGSASAPAAMAPQAISQQQMQQVTPAQLKSMADKTVQPLLDELKQHPNDADLMAHIGAVYGAGHQYDIAQQYFERAVKIKPNAAMYTGLAEAYHFSGSDDKSMESLNRALEIDPKFANALYNLGVLKMKVKGDKAGAIALWEKLVKTNPNNPHVAQVEQMIARVKSGDKL